MLPGIPITKTSKSLLIVIGLCFVYLDGLSQCDVNPQLWKKILFTDESEKLSGKQKLAGLYFIKQNAEKCSLNNDSSYVLALIKIGKYEASQNEDYARAITSTEKALEINRNLKTQGSKTLNVMACYNLGYYYDQQYQYKKAMSYYDSTILFCRKVNDNAAYEINAHFAKTYIYLLTGDYEKAIDESNIGIYISIQKKDTLNYIYFLSRKAWALYYENNILQSLNHIKEVITLAKNKDPYELTTSFKLCALIYEKKKHFDSAIYFYNQSINSSISLNYKSLAASNYNDLGNFYLNMLQDYAKASACYYKTLFYAKQLENTLDRRAKNVLAYTNLAETRLRENKLSEAETFFLLTFSNLNISLHGDIKNNPLSPQLSQIANKDILFALMDNKTKLHLMQFKKTGNKAFLDVCIKTCELTDSVITQMRHEQLGEQSKLYWRNKTHEFFTTAMEISFLANKPERAFYFMERSRAVLLNDQLNEIGATASLPLSAMEKLKNYKDLLIDLEQKLSAQTETSKEYSTFQQKYQLAKTDFERYIHSLETIYPIYYQYKYDDKVPALTDLKSFLLKNNQSFVHYFTGGTVTYILGITPTQTRFIRLSQKRFDKETLSRFLQFCANKQALNYNYNTFAELSNSIYASLFEQLQLPKGRVVICMDNTIIPFEALCTDAKGKHFLLDDYSFDYAYSSRFLMKKFNNPPAKGNFAGFAPVSFVKHLDVVDLKNAATALNTSASYYGNDKLFTHQNASCTNFFKYAPSYSVVSIFSHAYADTTDNEPVLFMHDSLIHLSELQKLNNPATRLVLLSACQTNVGKNATGEGIYSLARGFAMAGIPSVSATLWKADEQMIYAISEKLNEYLAEGMNKDEALQKAKLYFVKNGNAEKMLPYYWANMILIGNTDSIQFEVKHNTDYLFWAGIGLIVIASTLAYFKRRKRVINNLGRKLISSSQH